MPEYLEDILELVLGLYNSLPKITYHIISYISYHSLVLPARLLKMEKSKVAKKELTHAPCFYSILCSAILVVFALQHYKHSRLLFSLPILNTGINDYPAIL